jgi:hypothetical protein
MSTVPVFKCKYCGKLVYGIELRTATSDPDGSILHELMQGMARNAICPSCQRKYNHYAKEGRSEEFLRGQLVPIDLDRYKKKENHE